MRTTLDIGNVEFASFPQRIAARLIDFFLASSLFGVFIQLTHMEVKSQTIDQLNSSHFDPTFGLGPWILLLPLIFLGYEVPTLASSGVTLGKRIMGICVVRTDGLIGIGLDRALMRTGIPMVIAILPIVSWFLYPIFQLWYFYDPLRQNMPDKIARTYVIRTPNNLFHPTREDDE